MTDRSRLFDRLADTFFTFCYNISPDVKLQALVVSRLTSFLLDESWHV